MRLSHVIPEKPAIYILYRFRQQQHKSPLCPIMQ